MDDTDQLQASESAEATTPGGVAPLSAVEARILGCLVEKAATTPEAYPLTLNALVTACNQKTSRDPLMQLYTGEVEHALRVMEDNGLVKVAPSSQRTRRYEHCFDAIYAVTARQRAVLCVMLLRGPQTLSEILNRTQRMTDFTDMQALQDSVERLLQSEPAMAVDLGRGAGQRENRYMHLLAGPVHADQFVSEAKPARATRTDLEARVEQLESALDALRAEVAELRQRAD